MIPHYFLTLQLVEQPELPGHAVAVQHVPALHLPPLYHLHHRDVDNMVPCCTSVEDLTLTATGRLE